MSSRKGKEKQSLVLETNNSEKAFVSKDFVKWLFRYSMIPACFTQTILFTCLESSNLRMEHSSLLQRWTKLVCSLIHLSHIQPVWLYLWMGFMSFVLLLYNCICWWFIFTHTSFWKYLWNCLTHLETKKPTSMDGKEESLSSVIFMSSRGNPNSPQNYLFEFLYLRNCQN